MSDQQAAHSASCIYVAYGVDKLDLDWIGSGAEVLIVHNDQRLERFEDERLCVRHLGDGTNVGFGAAANLAATHASNKRLVFANPDTQLEPSHWTALTAAVGEREAVTVPLSDEDGCPTTVLARCFTPATLLASALRLRQRLVPRHARGRRGLERLRGRDAPAVERHARDHWLSGAVLSMDAALFRHIGGFDEQFFLYYEDADLFRRIGRSDPAFVVRVADTEPGVHLVGGTSTTTTVARIRAESAALFAAGERGLWWRVVEAVVKARLLVLTT